MRRLNPTLSPQARQAVRVIVNWLGETEFPGRSLEGRALFHDGRDGQRMLSRQTIEDLSPVGQVQDPNLIAAGLEIYFLVLCHLIAAGALASDSVQFLEDMRLAPPPDFSRRMVDVLSGRFHAGHGVNAFLSTFETPWHHEELAQRLERPMRGVILALAGEIEDGQFDIRDPLQRLHRAVFPANLSHATGQFYTPPWLAEYVLLSTGWRPGERIIDPFCGSGVFLLSALQAALSQGHAADEIAQTLAGIDLSPAAACAAKTNLLLACARHDRTKVSGLALNILCADALAPAVEKGRRQGRGMALGARLAVFDIECADVLVTNPPWVGWEYIPRGYRDLLNPAWQVYSLFEHRGMKAAFLKEDLSTLCVPAALDLYLRDRGRAGLVLRQSTMKSDLAGRGMRRLSIFKDRDPLELTHIHDFGSLHVFEGAVAPASVWLLNKGAKTSFPVPVSSWNHMFSRAIDTDCPLEDVLRNTRIVREYCRPLSAADPEGRWTFDAGGQADPYLGIKGSNGLRPRIGFFTGGANAVYYLEHATSRHGVGSRYRNIVVRAKRQAPQMTVDLEPELIYRVVRGRDVSFWNVRSEVFVLNPHTPETKILPLPERELQSNYPKCFRYLRSMRKFLDERRGFAGWEKETQRNHFYAIQRIGSYSFSPYKVCWSYISDDFVIAVCGSGDDGKPLLPNDKVVFLPASTREEAHFLAGILSFNVIRASVISSVSGRQISGNVIRPYALPAFDPQHDGHRKIAEICEDGHRAMTGQDLAQATAIYEALNWACADLFGLPSSVVETAAQRIAGKLGYYPFKPARQT